jgi:hypothetical protein
MKRLIQCSALLLASCVSLAAFPPAAAGQDLLNRLGNELSDHLSNRLSEELREQVDWRYVVPSHEHYHQAGTYYSHNGVHYYVPAAPPPGFYEGQPAASIRPQPVKLQFGGFKQTHQLAERLKFEANRLCLDMHYNYPHNRGFAQTYREAYEILQTADNLGGARLSRSNIRQQATELDELLHHVQEDIKPWTRNERRPIGEGGINGKAEVMESILHHLLYDVGVSPQHLPEEEQAPPPRDSAAPAPDRGR